MKRIWKYTLSNEDPTTVLEMPKGSRILSCARQGEEWRVWAEVDDEAIMVRRTIEVALTGGYAPRPAVYVGTFMSESGSFVGHVYDRGERG